KRGERRSQPQSQICAPLPPPVSRSNEVSFRVLHYLRRLLRGGQKSPSDVARDAQQERTLILYLGRAARCEEDWVAREGKSRCESLLLQQEESGRGPVERSLRRRRLQVRRPGARDFALHSACHQETTCP